MDRERERALVFIFAIAALSVGALAATASYAVSALAGGIMLIVLLAWILPLTWLGPLLAALVPFQFYLSVPAASVTLRAALIFVFAAALRIIVDQRTFSFVLRPSSLFRASMVGGRRSYAWLFPAALFLFAALFAALGAQDRYAAFKGIYDWLVVFLTAMVVAALAPSTGTVRRILSILIIGGAAQALLGLLEYMLGLDTVLQLLRLPVSGFLYQPNLLRDRLADLSFNWVAFDRALPFGTFINGIDYAVFLSSILSLIIALVITRDDRSHEVYHCEESRIPSGAAGFAAQSRVADPRQIPRPLRGATPSGERSDEAIPNMADVAPESAAFTSPLTRVRNAAAAHQQNQEHPSAVGRRWSLAAVAGPRSSVALGVAAVLIAFALLLTFKGSGFLALLGGMAAIALASLSRLSKRTVAIGLAVIAAALVVALPFADLIGQRALFLVQREQGSLGTAGRVQIWASLVQFVAQRPLFGYGLNNAIALIPPQWTLRDGALGFVFSTPESAYVSALVETGFAGFVSLVAWLLMAVANGYQRARGAKEPALYIAMVAALVALMFGNLTVSGLTTDQNGMLLGMLIGLIHGSQKDD